jgi:hypothetical protein
MPCNYIHLLAAVSSKQHWHLLCASLYTPDVADLSAVPAACLQSHRPHMQQLPCQVVATVPRAAADAAASAAGVDPRRSSPFISFAQIAAAEVRELQSCGCGCYTVLHVGIFKI